MAALNPKEFSRGTKVEPPYFKASKPDESFQLVCRNLEEGDIPLCLEYKESLYKIQDISISAYNVHKLLNSIELSIVTAGGEFRIKTIEDYMEGVKLWI